MAAQNGTDIEEDIDSVPIYDMIQAGAGGELKTTYKALGTSGAEIGFVYKLDDDGTYETTFTQASDTSSTGKFSYAPATKVITFERSETPIQGDFYACVYKFKPAGSQRISVSGDSIPDTALLAAYGLARDTCTGELFPAVIEGQVQIDANWSFDVSADGEPAVQNLNMEFVKGCLQKNLYTFTIFTEEETE